jgi:hypothetical protein
MSKQAVSALTALLAAAVLAACAMPEGESPSQPTLTLSEDGCSRTGPETLPTGAVTIAVQNQSGGLGSFQMLRLDGEFLELVAYVAEEQARIATGQPPAGAPANATEVGRLVLGPMGTDVLEATLTPGRYGVLCGKLTASEDAFLSIYAVGPYSASD